MRSRKNQPELPTADAPIPPVESVDVATVDVATVADSFREVSDKVVGIRHEGAPTFEELIAGSGKNGPDPTRNLVIEVAPMVYIERTDSLNWSLFACSVAETTGRVARLAKNRYVWRHAGYFGSPAYAFARAMSHALEAPGLIALETFAARVEEAYAVIVPRLAVAERCKGLLDAADEFDRGGLDAAAKVLRARAARIAKEGGASCS